MSVVSLKALFVCRRNLSWKITLITQGRRVIRSFLCSCCIIYYNMYCSIVQHITTYCSVLQRITTYCSVLQHITTYCSVLQYITTYCSVLQYTTTYCSVLQYTTTYCSIVQYKMDIAKLTTPKKKDTNNSCFQQKITSC